jgi:predicted ester cyclase
VGPAAWYATALWLRGAFADLRHEIDTCVVDGDVVAVHATMSGRHTGVMVVYDADARVKQAFPPTGRSFAITQSHWLRIRDGKVVEHWANRDDMAMAEQLGWVPLGAADADLPFQDGSGTADGSPVSVTSARVPARVRRHAAPFAVLPP